MAGAATSCQSRNLSPWPDHIDDTPARRGCREHRLDRILPAESAAEIVKQKSPIFFKIGLFCCRFFCLTLHPPSFLLLSSLLFSSLLFCGSCSRRQTSTLPFSY